MDEYYINQAGNGLSVFQGSPYQRGYGWFGRLIKGLNVLPILKYIGKKVFEGGVNISKDIMSGESIKDSAKQQLKTTTSDIVGDIFDKIAQKGKGNKRRRRTLKFKNKRRKIGKRARKSKVYKKKPKQKRKKRSRQLKFDFLK